MDSLDIVDNRGSLAILDLVDIVALRENLGTLDSVDIVVIAQVDSVVILVFLDSLDLAHLVILVTQVILKRVSRYSLETPAGSHYFRRGCFPS